LRFVRREAQKEAAMRIGRVLAWGVALACLALGCSNGAAGNKKDAGKAAAKKHDHPEEGPHGGPLAEWGDEKYHAEFTVDHKTKKAVVYILDGSAAKSAPIAIESVTLTLTHVKPAVILTLAADPQDGDPKGSASRFSGTHPSLAKEADFKGEVSATVGGKPYAGAFAGHGHPHE
jgi:hypothetical protein